MYQPIAHADDLTPWNVGQAFLRSRTQMGRGLPINLHSLQNCILVQTTILELRIRDLIRKLYRVARRQQHVEQVAPSRSIHHLG